jgi:hypothetical protein
MAGTLPSRSPSIALIRAGPEPSSLRLSSGYKYVLKLNTMALDLGSLWRTCLSQRKYVYKCEHISEKIWGWHTLLMSTSDISASSPSYKWFPKGANNLPVVVIDHY